VTVARPRAHERVRKTCSAEYGPGCLRKTQRVAFRTRTVTLTRAPEEGSVPPGETRSETILGRPVDADAVAGDATPTQTPTNTPAVTPRDNRPLRSAPPSVLVSSPDSTTERDPGQRRCIAHTTAAALPGAAPDDDLPTGSRPPSCRSASRAPPVCRIVWKWAEPDIAQTTSSPRLR